MQSVRLLTILVFLSLVTPLSGTWYPAPSLAAEADETKNETQQTPEVRLNRPILKPGSQGNEVSELQAALKLLGYYSGKVDGVYSESTAIAVSRFQQAAGLKPDGVVGTDTWNRLFPGTVTPGTASTSPPANSAASFPVPSASRTTSSNSSQTTTAASSRTSNQQATTAAAPRTSNQQATTAATPRTSNQQATTAAAPRTSNRQATNSETPRTSNRQATNSGTPRTSNRQATTAAAPRTYNRQASNAETARTSNRQAPRRSTSQAQSENDSSSQSNLPILRVGAQGPSVVQLQRRLRNLGFYKGRVNGIFDEATLASVQAAQQRFQLDPDGVVGPATWNVLAR